MENQVPYEDGSCYQLLDQGPCQDGWWYILDDSAPLGVACKMRTCLDSAPNSTVLWGGKCEEVGSHSHCDSNLVLHVTPYGVGTCDCAPGYRWDDGQKLCLHIIELKTLLVLPEACEDSEEVTPDGECRHVVRNLEGKTDILQTFITPKGKALQQLILITRRGVGQHMADQTS